MRLYQYFFQVMSIGLWCILTSYTRGAEPALADSKKDGKSYDYKEYRTIRCQKAISTMSLALDSDVLAVGTACGLVRTFDLKQKTTISETKVSENAIKTMAWMNHNVLMATDRRRISLIDIRSGCIQKRTCLSEGADITRLTSCRLKPNLLAICLQGESKIRFLNISDFRQEIPLWYDKKQGSVECLVFNEDDQSYLIGTSNGYIVRTLMTAKGVSAESYATELGRIKALALSFDNELLGCSGLRATAIYHMQSLRKVHLWKTRYQSDIPSKNLLFDTIGFAAQDTMLLGNHVDGSTWYFNFYDRGRKKLSSTRHKDRGENLGGIATSVISDDGAMFAVASKNDRSIIKAFRNS